MENDTVLSLLDYKFRRKLGYIFGPIAIAIGITLLVLFFIYNFLILLVFSIVSFILGITFILASYIWIKKWLKDARARIEEQKKKHPYVPPKKAHTIEGAEIYRGFIELSGVCCLDIFENNLQYFHYSNGDSEITDSDFEKGKYVSLMQKIYDEMFPIGSKEKLDGKCKIMFLTWNSSLESPSGSVVFYLDDKYYELLKKIIDDFVDDKRFVPEFLLENN